MVITGSTLRSSSSGMWQAMAWCSDSNCMGGVSSSQTSPSFRWHRVEKGQPLGGSRGLGRLPSSTIRRFSTSGSAMGTAESSASV